MDLHIVGGFLGSGKSTAIVNALKVLLPQGRRVGVVTNDKGRHLVDTALFAGADVPTVEVPGGCFRCNYGDFQDRIAQLQSEARPDLIFAESVGSCVDLVGPVIKPLLAMEGNGVTSATYSVFADVRLLARRLRDQPLPFSEHICYIFETQLEEAGVLVVNKIDLLSEAEVEDVAALARARFPDKAILLQSSLTPEGVTPWLRTLAAWAAPLPEGPLDVDYDRYIAGAAQMAWLDETVTLNTSEALGTAEALSSAGARPTVVDLIDAIVGTLRELGAPVGHLKFFVAGGGRHGKLSFLALDEAGAPADWAAAIPPLGATATVTINARVQTGADTLRERVQGALVRTLEDADVSYHVTSPSAFSPQVPRPEGV